MSSQPKIRNTLKYLPFYNEEIEEINKIFSNNKLLSVLPFFPKKTKKITHKKLSELLPFPPIKNKRQKINKTSNITKITPLL